MTNEENEQVDLIKQEDKDIIYNLNKKINKLNAVDIKVSNISGINSKNVNEAIKELYLKYK